MSAEAKSAENKRMQKLELTWVGKDEPIAVEPRILIEDAERSNRAKDPNTENLLIHGDNLLALKALEAKYAGKVKCIYIDPPYNTGSDGFVYNDKYETYSAIRCKLSNSNSGTCGFCLRFRCGFSRSPFSIERE